MRKPLPPAWALGAALALLGACDGPHYEAGSPVTGSGRLATESRPVQDFTAVAVSAGGHLIIEQTGLESLEVTAEDNVLPLVRSETRNGRLVLGFPPDVSVTVTRPILFRLTVRELTGIEASGASRVELRGLASPELTLRLSGASRLSATGSVARAWLALSGASRCQAPGLESRVITADLSGASHALVRATDFLEVNASGASFLEYLGSPALSASVSGGSFVRRVGP